MSMYPYRFNALSVFAVALLATSAFAQSERGTILGTVKDSSGAVIPNAKVTVTNAATNVANRLTSSDTGDYAVTSLQVGSYTVRVEKEGFRPSVTSGVTVNASSTVRADANLEVGTTGTAIEVQASAVQLSTENAKSSAAVTNKMVDELPLVVGGTMRSPFDLAATNSRGETTGWR